MFVVLCLQCGDQIRSLEENDAFNESIALLNYILSSSSSPASWLRLIQRITLEVSIKLTPYVQDSWEAMLEGPRILFCRTRLAGIKIPFLHPDS